MDVYAGYSTDQTQYLIVKGYDTVEDSGNTRDDSEKGCRAYYSDGTYWIEEWLAW